MKISDKITRVNSEHIFYRDLFIRTGYWNKPWPNEEEMLRWLVIRNFIENEIIVDLRGHDRDSFSIVDIGCGRGWLSNLCTPYGKVKAIEPVRQVVRYGKKLFPHLDISTTHINQIVDDHQKFDIVLCSEVIEHVPAKEKKQFSQILCSLAKSGGYVIITTPRKEVMAEWQQYTDPNQPIEEWLSANEISSLFQDLKVIDMQLLAIKPSPEAPDIPVYQLWLFKKM